MKSSSGVLCLSLLQLVIGLSLLAIYESYKVSYMNTTPLTEKEQTQTDDKGSPVLRVRTVYTPLDWMFYLSIFNNAFSLFFCLAGVLHSVREVVIGFFAFSAVEMILAFHFFVDVWTDIGIRNWSNGDLGSYERAATAFIFFNFVLSFCATVFGVKALNEIRSKAREEYHRLSVISDNLQFNPDTDRE